MKKAKILAVILVMSLMLTGVAYALWNQDTTVSTYAEMGKMDVQVICDPCVYPMSFMPGIGEGYWWPDYADAEDYMDPLTGTVSWDYQSINVTVGDMYPGAKYGLNYAIKNTGDVPFKLNSATVSFTGGNYDLFTKLTGSFQFLYQHVNKAPQIITVPASALTSAGLGQAIVDTCTENNVVLYPGDELKGTYAYQDKIATFMQVAVADTIIGDDFENQGTSFNVVFDWQQCTPTQIG